MKRTLSGALLAVVLMNTAPAVAQADPHRYHKHHQHEQSGVHQSAVQGCADCANGGKGGNATDDGGGGADATGGDASADGGTVRQGIRQTQSPSIYVTLVGEGVAYRRRTHGLFYVQSALNVCIRCTNGGEAVGGDGGTANGGSTNGGDASADGGAVHQGISQTQSPVVGPFPRGVRWVGYGQIAANQCFACASGGTAIGGDGGGSASADGGVVHQGISQTQSPVAGSASDQTGAVYGQIAVNQCFACTNGGIASGSKVGGGVPTQVTTSKPTHTAEP
jgi:hypothetical protein